MKRRYSIAQTWMLSTCLLCSTILDLRVLGFAERNLPPKVQIVEPTDQAVLLAGTDVQFRIAVSDADGYALKVELFSGTSLIGFDKHDYLVKPSAGEPATFQIAWKNAPVGDHTITAKATDNSGSEAASSPIKIHVNSRVGATIVTLLVSDPEASESNPQNTGTFKVVRTGDLKSKLNVHYATSGNAFNGIDYVKLTGLATIPANESSVAIIVTPIPDKAIEGKESVIVTLSQLVFIARPTPEEDYLVGSPNSASVTIYEDELRNLPPKVEVTNPRNETIFDAPANIEIRAEAADSDGRIARVEFFSGDKSLGTDATAPFSITWSGVAAGSYALTAKATDNLGATTVSQPIKIKVQGSATGQIVLSPKAIGTISFLPELNRWETPAKSAIQSAYFKTTTSNRNFRRGFVEFAIPEIQDQIVKATLFLSENRAIVLSPTPSDGHELAYYSADLQVTTNDYNRAATLLTTFATDVNLPPDTFSFDLTSVLSGFRGKNLGFRIKLKVDPEFNGLGSLGSTFQDLSGGSPPRLVVVTAANKTASVVITSPAPDETFPANSALTIKATAIDSKGYMPRVEFFANGQKIGASEIAFIRAPAPGTPIYHSIEWKSAVPGTYELTARASNSAGESIISPSVKISIKTNLTRFVVERRLPASYSPGTPVIVELVATIPADSIAYAIEDKAPAGWSIVTNISNDGAYDSVTRQVKFGPFFDNTARILRYSVTPPVGDRGEKVFSGTASLDGADSPIGGASRINSAVLHPADNNPANNAITLSELTAYGAAWKSGKLWPIDPNPIPVSYVTRAGALWRNGESYVYDPKAGSAPIWWVNTSSIAKAGVLGIRSASQSIAMREIQNNPTPNLASVVTIHLTPSSQVTSCAVEEEIPEGATVSQITEDGVFDSVSRKIRWGPFLDNTPRRLSYQASAPSLSRSRLGFSGLASFDGSELEIPGQPETKPQIASEVANIHSIRRLLNGGVELTWEGQAGETYSIEATGDLKEWIQLGKTTSAEATFHFTDREGTKMGQRFYRARRAPSVD